MDWDLTITPVIYISLLPSRGATAPPCNVSAGGGTRWRLQYDVYQHFLPENDLSEQSLFTGIHAVADVSGAVKNSKWVRSSQPDQWSAVWNFLYIVYCLCMAVYSIYIYIYV